MVGKNPSIYVQDVKTEGVASFFAYDVEESTVGQFTGLLDKNGNDIYVRGRCNIIPSTK